MSKCATRNTLVEHPHTRYLSFPPWVDYGDRFGQDDLKGVAERLEAMVSSMGVLIHMPEAEDRAATLAELQEKLETLLQPKLREVGC